jgi:tape measure domain-containing protein
MAKKITKDEIFEKGLLSDVIKDANEAIQVFDKLDTELLKVSKSYKAIIDNSSKNSKGSITELINASKQLNQITEQTVLIEKEKLKVDQQLRISKKEQLSAEQSLQRQREKGIAQMEREARKVAEAERPYNKMSATLNDLRKKYKDLAVSGNENTASARAMKREIDSLDKTLKKVDGSAGQFQRNVGNYPQTFKAIGSALGQLGLAFGVFSSIKGIAETEIKLQSLQLALKNVMGTQERYNQSFSFLSKLSRDYGQDLTVLVDTYKGFIASSESSNLSLEARNKIYQSVIKSGSSLALSNDQIQGSLLAISQMFSKGTVSAEELRGQLGERLPGAFGIMAKSIGVSESELGKMMQKGEVMAKDVLPKFAEELEKTFGANASKNLETIGGAWNVLQTEISLYINEANKGGAITKQIAGAIGFLAKNIDTIVSVMTLFIRQLLIYKATQAIVNSGLVDFTKNIFGYNKAITQVAQNTDTASTANSKFGQSLKSIGWTTAIALASELALKLYDIVSGAEFARIELDYLAKSTAKGATEGSKIVASIEAQAKGNRELTKSLIEQRIEKFKTARQEIVNERYRLQGQLRGMNQVTSPIEYGKLQGQLLVVNGYLKENYSITNELYSAYKNVNSEISTSVGLTKKETKEVKEKIKAYKDAKEQIDALMESQQRLNDFHSESSIEDNAKRLQMAIDLEMQKIGISGEYSIDVINQIIDKEKELKKALIESTFQQEIARAKASGNVIDQDLARDKRQKALDDLDEETINKKKETNKKLELEQERYADESYKSEEERLKKEKELKDKADAEEKKRLEEMRNFRRQIFNELLDELKRQSEARESQYDKDIQTQKDFQSQLQAQANAGNITAQQSIAQSIEAEKKATIEKAKEAKKQQQIEDIKTLYNLINQNIDKGDNAGVATAKATASMSLIKGIAKLFQGFAKGTKWKLGDEDKPFMSGVDGHIVRVDSSEAIINGGLMNKAEKAGIKSTEQLVNSAVMYQNYNPQMMRMNDDRQGFNSSSAMMSIEPITQRLESLEQTIKNKTEFRIDPYIVHGIVKGVMETEKSKNLTRKNIYKS